MLLTRTSIYITEHDELHVKNYLLKLLTVYFIFNSNMLIKRKIQLKRKDQKRKKKNRNENMPFKE